MENIIIFLSIIFGFSYIFWSIDHYITTKKYPISYVVSAINSVVLIALIICHANYETPAPEQPEKLMKLTVTKYGVSACTIEPLDVEKILQLRDSSDIEIELIK